MGILVDFTHTKNEKKLPVVGPKFGMSQLACSTQEVYTVRPQERYTGSTQETQNTKAGDATGRTTGGRTTNGQDHRRGPEAGPPTARDDTKGQRPQQRHQDHRPADRNGQQKQERTAKTGTDSKQQTGTDSNSNQERTADQQTDSNLLSKAANRIFLSATSFFVQKLLS